MSSSYNVQLNSAVCDSIVILLPLFSVLLLLLLYRCCRGLQTSVSWRSCRSVTAQWRLQTSWCLEGAGLGGRAVWVACSPDTWLVLSRWENGKWAGLV